MSKHRLIRIMDKYTCAHKQTYTHTYIHTYMHACMHAYILILKQAES